MIQAVVSARKMAFYTISAPQGLIVLRRIQLSRFNITSDLNNRLIKFTGPILCLDIGTKRVGAAICDQTLVAITRLEAIQRSNWKQLLRDVRDLVQRFDARTLVIGFPLSLSGAEGSAADNIRTTAQKFAISLPMPVYLQDERLSSAEAEENLRAQGLRGDLIKSKLDSEAAAIILRDFLAAGQQKILVERPSR
jgi:putative Holliday junction resolvase